MTYEIRRLLRGASLALAVATGAAMLSATPGEAISDDDNCNYTVAWEGDEIYICHYCEVEDGVCEYDCTDDEKGTFDCEGEF